MAAAPPAGGAVGPAARMPTTPATEQLDTAEKCIAGYLSYDSDDVELAHLLEDEANAHRYFYWPYNLEDAAGTANAAWRQQVRPQPLPQGHWAESGA
jgi:hypothetical protein